MHAEFVAAAAGGTSGAGVGRTSAELLSPEDFARAPRVVALMLAFTRRPRFLTFVKVWGFRVVECERLLEKGPWVV